MKAAVYIKANSGKFIQIMDFPTPVPKDNEVLIRVRAASVNPLDWRLKRRRPGVDVAGEVLAVGKRVAQIKPGDAVFGTSRGAFAEYICASEAALIRKPENLTFEQAACIPIAGLTALQALRDKRRHSGGSERLDQRSRRRRWHLCSADREVAWRQSHRRVQHQEC